MPLLNPGQVFQVYLGCEFPRAHRHLKDGRVLPCAQFRQLDDLAIRQFERVMVDDRLVLIHLPKPGHLVREPFETEAIGDFALKIFFKGKLCAR